VADAELDPAVFATVERDHCDGSGMAKIVARSTSAMLGS
jgi:hypothetical protein